MRRLWPLALTIALIASACGGDSGEPTASSPTGETSDAANPTSTMGTSTTSVDEAEEDPETTEETSSGSNTGGIGCAVTVSGDVDQTLDYPDSQFLSDHWSSEEELRDYVEFLGEDIAEGTYDELVARGEPIVSWFLLTCFDPQDPGPGVQVFHTNATNRDQFPMEPATYPVSGGLFDANGPAGTVTTNLNLTLDDQFAPVPDSGEMVISRWDSSRLEGVLTFDGVETFPEGDARVVSVEVDFVFDCAPTHTACG